MQAISLKEVQNRFSLENLTPALGLSERFVSHTEVNRPALQLVGFYECFDRDRIQIVGKMENAYLQTLPKQELAEVYDRLLSTKFLCLLICRNLTLPAQDTMLALAEKHQVPVLRTERPTSAVTSDLIRYLYSELAPSTLLHGVLVDCFGEGVLITGESGLGKSETALELIERGHRFVADDVVEISKVSDVDLIGRSPKVLENLIELRGIGILNVKDLFGIQSVKTSHSIDMVVHIENWDPDKEYNRLGVEETTEILGNKVTCYNIPIRPGRNLAIIIESAAIQHRQKKMGYSDAAQELRNRVIKAKSLEENSFSQGE